MSGDAATMSFMAPGLNENTLGYGRVRVFTYNDDTSEWDQKGEPIINYDETDARGRAMHMSRDGLNVAVGSPSKIEHRGGHVRVYGWDEGSGSWKQKGDAVPGGGSYHIVGHNVAINTDGTRLAVGSPFNSLKGKTAGRVRVYEWKPDRTKGGVAAPGWVLRGSQIDGAPGDTGGFSVSIGGKGNMLAIGAPQYKHKKDKDALFFNAATQPQLDYDDEDVEPDVRASLPAQMPRALTRRSPRPDFSDASPLRPSTNRRSMTTLTRTRRRTLRIVTRMVSWRWNSVRSLTSHSSTPTATRSGRSAAS